MDDRNLNTKEIAELKKKSISYICRKAREAYKKGYTWPIKSSGAWEAPLDEWNAILSMTNPVKKKKIEKRQPTPLDPDNKLYSINKASKLLAEQFDIHLSTRWLSELAKRSIEIGNRWPERRKGAVVAPIHEWKQVAEDENLKAWVRKKK